MPYQNARGLRVALFLHLGRKGLTAGQFAKAAGFNRVSVDRMLNGVTKVVTVRTAKKWAKGLGWSLEKLFNYVPTDEEIKLVLERFERED